MYTTQKTAIEEIRLYLEKLNLLMIGFEYRKGNKIEVKTSEGMMTFQYGHEFKLLTNN